VRLVDLPRQGADTPTLGKPLVAELLAPGAPAVVALRAHGRYERAYDPLRLPRRSSTGLRPEGVYCITGGLGRIGLALAEFLAREVRARLVLLGRSALPAREEWTRWLAENGEREAERAAVIRRLQALEDLGSEVLTVSADVADEAALKQALRLGEERFGPLHGVIHGAGLVGPESRRPLLEVDAEETERQFHAKIGGALALERVLAGRTLDFRILLSSVSTTLGGLGYGAYAAANAFLDAFAVARQDSPDGPWTSLAWDAWLWEPPGAGQGASELARLALTPEEGVESFRRFLGMLGVPEVLVSTADLGLRIERWGSGATFEERAGAPRSGVLGRHSRPDLQNDFVAPAEGAERRVAEVWQEILGIDQVGAHDNFFELGGSSLLATRLISDLRTAFGVEVPYHLFFEEPTVAEQAAKIATQSTAENGGEPLGVGAIRASAEQDFLQQLEEIADLSDDEVQAMMGGSKE
jgi:NADP-dependent 3-hydroxy acid dehydrogenase YdfG/acyl carrier protein